jgi:hypothetical protein
MSEWDLVRGFPLKLIPTLLFAICYIIGGRSWKWVRRYIGPVLFVASCAILAQVFSTFSWKIVVLLVYAPILTLPYSIDSERAFYVAALTSVALVIGIIFGSPLGILQSAFACLTGIFFIANHPIPAVDEEGIIAISSVLLIPFMVIR